LFHITAKKAWQINRQQRKREWKETNRKEKIRGRGKDYGRNT